MSARLRIDPYVVALLTTVGLATLLPVHDAGAVMFDHLTTASVALLFFLYGGRLSPREALEGARHWRLHAVILSCTYLLFPLLALAAWPLRAHVLGPQLYTGLLFLAVLPSTVQSSIAFVSMARGNIAGAVCSATFSNVLGVVATPLLVMLVMRGEHVSVSASAIGDVAAQLLVPFALGQVLRPWTVGFLGRHKRTFGLVDRGAILLVVYGAFSKGVTDGIWGRLPVWRLLALVAACALLLALALVISDRVARRLRFGRGDRIAIVFCGSKKSLASGLPMAAVLFAGQDVALLVLPLMVFHQVQLMVCSVIAPRWGCADTETLDSVHENVLSGRQPAAEPVPAGSRPDGDPT